MKSWVTIGLITLAVSVHVIAQDSSQLLPVASHTVVAAATIALGTNPVPAGPSFGEVFNPFITSNGHVVFQANSSDIFTSDGRTIMSLVREDTRRQMAAC